MPGFSVTTVGFRRMLMPPMYRPGSSVTDALTFRPSVARTGMPVVLGPGRLRNGSATTAAPVVAVGEIFPASPAATFPRTFVYVDAMLPEPMLMADVLVELTWIPDPVTVSVPLPTVSASAELAWVARIA